MTGIRARVKPIEQMPEWAQCCDKFLKHQAKTQKKELFVVATSHRGYERLCSWCNAVMPPGIDAVLAEYPDGTNLYAMELLDLDEGGEQ